MAQQHKGTGTFVIQRFTAVILIPLAVWFLIAVVSHLGAGYDEARAWAGQWQNGVLLGALILVAAIHMLIGMGEIIADYIHSGARAIFQFFNWLIMLGVIAAGLWSVYSLSFAG